MPAIPSSARPDKRHLQPLWERVDANRWRLVRALALFTLVSSVSLAAALALLVWLVGVFAGAESVSAALSAWFFSEGVFIPWAAA